MVVLDAGEEAFATLTRFASEAGISAASLTAIGAFERATIGWFDMTSKSYRKIEVDEQCEVLSAIGDVAIGDDGKPLIADEDFQRKVAQLEIDLSALEITELRVLARESAGKGPGPESSLLKIRGTEIQQRLTELTLEAVGKPSDGPPEMGGRGIAPAIPRATSAWMTPLLASKRPPSSRAGEPSKSVTTPPASRTKSVPAATSHGFRPRSQNASYEPSATIEISTAAAPHRRSSRACTANWCSGLRRAG